MVEVHALVDDFKKSGCVAYGVSLRFVLTSSNTLVNIPGEE